MIMKQHLSKLLVISAGAAILVGIVLASVFIVMAYGEQQNETQEAPPISDICYPLMGKQLEHCDEYGNLKCMHEDVRSSKDQFIINECKSIWRDEDEAILDLPDCQPEEKISPCKVAVDIYGNGIPVHFRCDETQLNKEACSQEEEEEDNLVNIAGGQQQIDIDTNRPFGENTRPVLVDGIIQFDNGTRMELWEIELPTLENVDIINATVAYVQEEEEESPSSSSGGGSSDGSSSSSGNGEEEGGGEQEQECEAGFVRNQTGHCEPEKEEGGGGLVMNQTLTAPPITPQPQPIIPQPQPEPIEPPWPIQPINPIEEEESEEEESTNNDVEEEGESDEQEQEQEQERK
jgi:hypothetical protein